MKKKFSEIFNNTIENIKKPLNEKDDTNYNDYYRRMYDPNYKSDAKKDEEAEERKYKREWERKKFEDAYADERDAIVYNRDWEREKLKNDYYDRRNNDKDDRSWQLEKDKNSFYWDRDDRIHERDRKEKLEDLKDKYNREDAMRNNLFDQKKQQWTWDLKKYAASKTIDSQMFMKRLDATEKYKNNTQQTRNNFELDKMDKQYKLEELKLLKQIEREKEKVKSEIEKMDKQHKIRMSEFNKEIKEKINAEERYLSRVSVSYAQAEASFKTEVALELYNTFNREFQNEMNDLFTDNGKSLIDAFDEFKETMEKIENAYKKRTSEWAYNNKEEAKVYLAKNKDFPVFTELLDSIKFDKYVDTPYTTGLKASMKNSDYSRYFSFKESSLSIDEQSLIFGSILNNINNIVSLEEEVSMPKVVADAGKAELKAAQTQGDVIRAKMKINSGVSMAKTSEKNKNIQDQIKDVVPNKKDVISGEKVNESADTYIDNSIARCQAQKEKNSEQTKKKNELLDKKIDTLQAAKARNNATTAQETSTSLEEEVKDVHPKNSGIDNSEEASTTSDKQKLLSNKDVIGLITERDLRFEKRIYGDLRRDSGHRVDRGEDTTADKRTPFIEAQNKKDIKAYEAMLFNGESGNALKYFINGEINNDNIADLEISKIMEKDPAVQTIIKKLKFDLKKVVRKTADERTYTDMKIMKSEFRSAFLKARKEYNSNKQLGR